MISKCISRKYPRTPHLPWSPGGTSDDRRMVSVDHLLGVPLIVSEKLDGSNVVLTPDCIFARSHVTRPTHASFDWLKAFHSTSKQSIPTNFSVFCEYTYAVHTIVYNTLTSYLWIIGVRDDESTLWLSWDDVELIGRELGVPTAPVLWDGTICDKGQLQVLTTRLGSDAGLFGPREGVVVRVAAFFPDEAFDRFVGKWVRAGHVPVDAEDWWKRPMQRQRLVE